MGPKAQAKTPRGEAVEDCPDEGAAGESRILRPREAHQGPPEMDSINSMLQQCLHFQHDLSERWEKETIKQDMRWRQMQIQVNSIRDELEQQQRGESYPQQSMPGAQHEVEEQGAQPSTR
ncbi:uncharacterized protein LOC126384335, partial [Xyrichtys novacula]